MFYLIAGLILVVCIAIGGVMVYRKNQTRIDADAAKAKSALDAINKK